ncbi:hypothetical protein LJR084_002456 [Variovorax sp. LjRoot84]|uniref:hypothetical protein n=1 Tax=Variovorax sp. LjRoot84 TaxID=3342340 RepID=UPI003ED117F3
MYIAHYNNPVDGGSELSVFNKYPSSLFRCDWLSLMYTVDSEGQLHIQASSMGHSVTVTPAEGRTFKVIPKRFVDTWVELVDNLEDGVPSVPISLTESWAESAALLHAKDGYGEFVKVTGGTTSFEFRKPWLARSEAANDYLVAFVGHETIQLQAA